MINETASSADDRPILRPVMPFEPTTESSVRSELRQMVMEVFTIEREPTGEPDLLMQRDGILLFNPDGALTATFEGRLLIDSEAAYRQLDEAFATIDHMPYFREHDGRQVIHAVRGRIHPKPRSWHWNAFLFVATFLSVLLLGTEMALSEIAATNRPLAEQLLANISGELWRGLPYALSLMLILGAHELGHYFAARYHKIAVTLPYFIPAPFFSFLGTFGAVIQQREPFRNRKSMFDIGAAGPLVGLVFAIPIVIIGLATSPTGPITPGGWVEGNSFIYALSKTLVFGKFLPSDGIDVYMNQLTQAGWAGLLVTSLNLIPLGQLDGGHILYSLLGEKARRLYLPIVGLMIVLVFISQFWLLWALLLFLLGRIYVPPLDMITPLDSRRRMLGLLALALFVLTFVPVPLTQVASDGSIPLPQNTSTVWLQMTVGVMFVYGWLRRR
ncbi:MAG: site-2 protease family protein [Anaerolineae bacterium]|nr:site-2 protease family protein [Anaerolineae bacterium]